MEKEQPTGGLHFVGKKDDLVAAKRSFRTLEDRDVLIVSHEGVFYALDSYCYREYSALQCLTQKERKWINIIISQFYFIMHFMKNTRGYYSHLTT